MLPLVLTVTESSQYQQSDFQSAFYLAGRLILSGAPLELYADKSSTSLMTTPFNAYAHQTLSQFPSAATAVYMYPPLIAASLHRWLGLVRCIRFWPGKYFPSLRYAHPRIFWRSYTDKRWSNFFFWSVLFLPIAQNFCLASRAIAIGLLPFSLGYWLLMKGHPLKAGLVWSLICLKPQFAPAVVLIVVAIALSGRFRCALGFVAGAAFLAVLSLITFGPEVFSNWLLTLKMASSIYSDPRYNSPGHLVTSLTPALTQVLPLDWRPLAKQACLAVGAIVAGHLLWLCRRLIGQNKRSISFSDSICGYVVVCGFASDSSLYAFLRSQYLCHSRNDRLW